MIFRTAAIPGYSQYYDWLIAIRLRPAVRVAALFVVGLNTFFLILDYLVFPDRLIQFALLRFLWIVAMLAVYVGVDRLAPLTSARLGCVLAGLFLIGLSGLGGGATSSYWPALMVLFLGMPVLMPLTARHSAEIVSILTLCFASLPLMTGESIGVESYGVPVFFVIATAIECVMSAAVLDGMRFADFKRRSEVELARDHLREMDRAKTRFTANIHHELRTPLTMILSPLAALRSGDYGDVPKSISSILATMEVNGRRLHRLINNLLDLAKLESDEYTIKKQEVSIEQLVRSIVAGVSPMAERKRIDLRTHGLDSLPVLHADPEAIDKVLMNLLGNALKFTDEGGEIEISAGVTPSGGIRIEVRDSGVGIPKDQLSKVFDRFAQVDGSSTRQFEGTGIGLSLASELVELHDGKIWAESGGLGAGTTMCFELPLGIGNGDGVGAADVPEGGRKSEPNEADECGRKPRAEIHHDAMLEDRTSEIEHTVDRWIQNTTDGADAEPQVEHDRSVPEVVIAEDNPDMRRLLRFLIAQEFRVRVAKNGREALTLIRESRPHAVVSDVMMPELSGTELCAAIKGNAATAHVPIMLVTSKAEDDMRIEGLERGADDYIAKPFHPRELMARIRALVRVRVLQEQVEAKNYSLEKAISQLREAQTKLVRHERLAAVGEMAAGVAHEVNNPVNFALNAVRVLRSEVDEMCEAADSLGKAGVVGSSDENGNQEKSREEGHERILSESAATVRELANIIADGLDRTHRLVGDLQAFSGFSHGEGEDVDVLAGVRSTMALLRPTFSGHHIEMNIDEPDQLPFVRADQSALNQVFMNLLKNAGEAIGEGPGVVNVSLALVDSDVLIEIFDTGPGIEQSSLARVFEPFYSTKPSSAGSGLGLSICRQIVEEYGGALSLESEIGVGTKATVRLPRAGA